MRHKILGTAFGAAFALLSYSAHAQSAPDPIPEPDGRGTLGGGTDFTASVATSATNSHLLTANVEIFDCLSERRLSASEIAAIGFS